MSGNLLRETNSTQLSSRSPGNPKMMNRMTRDEWGQLIVKRIDDNTERFTSPEDLVHRVLDNPQQMFNYIHDLEEDRRAVKDLMDLLNYKKMRDRQSKLEKDNKNAAKRLGYQSLVIVVLVGVVGVLSALVMGAQFWKFLKRNECAAYVGEWKISKV